MAEGEDKSDESSKFNEAGLQILRLDNLWKKAEDYASEGSLERWMFILDSIFRELKADVNHLSDKQQQLIENKKLKLKVLIAMSGTRTEWHKALNERHQYLKVLQDKTGKGGSYSDGSEEDTE